MEELALTTPSSQKAILKQKIRALEEEKSLLESDILSLKDRLELIELERESNALSVEIGTLQVEKTLLEEKYSSFSMSGSAQNSGAIASSESENLPTSEFEEISTKLAEATTEIQVGPESQERGATMQQSERETTVSSAEIDPVIPQVTAESGVSEAQATA